MQVNNDRMEFEDSDYDQAVEDRKNSILDEYNNGYKRSRQENYPVQDGANGLYFSQWLRCLERGHDPTYKG